jgi:hypothetical protein
MTRDRLDSLCSTHLLIRKSDESIAACLASDLNIKGASALLTDTRDSNPYHPASSPPR